MSIDNSELLMLLGGKKSKSTIGIAGQKGFGVGVYGGDPVDLTAMGLAPMEGCGNPNSENYGNYIHTNGSVMVFIPAFTIRIGNASAPLYSKYGADAIEIGDVELNGKDGWAIPRGFYDGGKLHSGFFIDKYLNSKDTANKQAISVKNGDPISLGNSYNTSRALPNCVGNALDAIELSRTRGEHYALVSCYQWAVISLVTQAHAQAATSEEACAWYDASGQKNYPKGNNNNGSDVDDNTITFTKAGSGSYDGVRKTGSAVPLAKTTHNGQVSGICDVNGNMWQPVLGWFNQSPEYYAMVALSMKMHNFTKNNYSSGGFFNFFNYDVVEEGIYNFWAPPALYATDDNNFHLCGVMPKTSEPAGTKVFGLDEFYTYHAPDSVLFVAGSCLQGSPAGIWCRNGGYEWTEEYHPDVSFRAAAYPP